MPIRLATLTDVVRMHEIRTSVGENRLSSPDRIRHQDYVALLEGQGRGWVFETLARRSGKAAKTAGTVAAFGIADAGTRSIWALFVEPGFERRGMGRALLDAMTMWLFEQGDGPIWLTTAPATRAEGFYRAAGWRETGRINGDIRFELNSARLSMQAGPREPGPAPPITARPGSASA